MEIVRRRAPRALLRVGAVVALVPWASACTRPQAPATEAETTAVAPSAASAPAPAVELGASAQLDSGNVAYRAKDYPAALVHYRSAAARQPSLAAAWMGISMAQTALGNKAAADSAMRRVEELAPGTMSAHPAGAPGGPSAPGASGALPPGHPALPGAPKR